MKALVPRCASVRLMFLDRSGPVAMRWMIERIRSLGSDGSVSVLMNNSIRSYKNTYNQVNQSRIDRVLQAADKRLSGFGRRPFQAEIATLRHPHPRVATRVDGGERTHIHVDVARQAMIRAAVSDAQAECGYFCAIAIHAWRASKTGGCHALLRLEIDHGLFQSCHQLADAVTTPPQVDQLVVFVLFWVVFGFLFAVVVWFV